MLLTCPLRVNIILKSYSSFLCRKWWTWNYFNSVPYSSGFGCLPDSNSWGPFRDCWQNTMYNKGKKTFYSSDSQAMNLWHPQTYSFESRGGPFLVQKSVWRSSFSRDGLVSKIQNCGRNFGWINFSSKFIITCPNLTSVHLKIVRIVRFCSKFDSK